MKNSYAKQLLDDSWLPLSVIPNMLVKSVGDLSGMCQLKIWHALLLVILNERMR